jgi:hypothetical protein
MEEKPMLRSLRRKVGAAGLAVSSLLPSARNVSFLGARAQRAAVAVEETIVQETAALGAAAPAAASATGSAGTRAVAATGAVAAGGIAAERGCGWVAKLASRGERLAESGAAEFGESAATPQGFRMAENEAANVFRQTEGKVLLPRFPGAMVAPLAEDGTAARALREGGFHIVGSTSEARLLIDPEAAILKHESIRLTAEVINTMTTTSLQSDAAVAKAFEAAFKKHTMMNFELNRATGLVRMSYANATGVTLTAEFNAYSVARAAAAAGALAPALKDRPGGLGS